MQFEIESFAALLKKHGVSNYLEIGAREGDTFHYIMTTLAKGSRGLAVDLPGGLWGKSTTGRKLERCVADLKGKGYDAEIYLGDSGGFDCIKLVVDRGPYGAILIDGDHTYHGVQRDWYNYKALAPIIAFHDIVGEGQSEKVHGNRVEVPRLWSEIKASGIRTLEFVAPDSAMGIGVCFP